MQRYLLDEKRNVAAHLINARRTTPVYHTNTTISYHTIYSKQRARIPAARGFERRPRSAGHPSGRFHFAASLFYGGGNSRDKGIFKDFRVCVQQILIFRLLRAARV